MTFIRSALSCVVASLAFAGEASAYCFEQAAQRYSVSATVLRSIADAESSMRPYRVTRNSDGTVDVGLMGINSVHFSELEAYGTPRSALLDPCVNVMVGAWLLAKQVSKHGMSWEAIGRYHSKTPSKKVAYQERIYQKLLQQRTGTVTQ